MREDIPTREPARRERLHAETNGCCIYCGKPVSLQEMEVEHIIPKAQGGADALTNVICSCPQCNAAKKDMTLMEYAESLSPRKRKTLFNRIDALSQQGKLPNAKRDLLLGLMQEARPKDAAPATCAQERFFRHFKGGEYKILCIARDCDDPSHELVVYQALYGDGQVWVRSREEFFSEVSREGYTGPRFVEIAEDELTR